MALKRQQIIDALVVRLQTISVANLYHTELGAHVYSWRTTAISDREMPGAIIRDQGRVPVTELTGTSANRQNQLLSIEVEIAIATEPLARQAIQDILKAIDVDHTLGATAIDVFDDGDSIYSDHQGQRVFEPTLKLRALYRTTKFQEE